MAINKVGHIHSYKSPVYVANVRNAIVLLNSPDGTAIIMADSSKQKLIRIDGDNTTIPAKFYLNNGVYNLVINRSFVTFQIVNLEVGNLNNDIFYRDYTPTVAETVPVTMQSTIPKRKTITGTTSSSGRLYLQTEYPRVVLNALVVTPGECTAALSNMNENSWSAYIYSRTGDPVESREVTAIIDYI